MATKPLGSKVLKAFGSRIRHLRTAKDWTLEDAEEHGWPSWQHLQKIESGQKNINFTTFMKLALLLKVDPADLVKGL